MALKSTIFKLDLAVADMTRHYYADHSLVIARHPSENDLRMLLRIVVFAVNAQERLQFAKGLSSTDEPDLWQHGLTGTIDHWIELGQPSEKRIKQACGKSALVTIYTYQKTSTKSWYEDVKKDLQRFKHLQVVQLSCPGDDAVASIVERTMRLNCNIDDEQILLSSDAVSLSFDAVVLKKR